MTRQDPILLYYPEAPSKSVRVSTYQAWLTDHARMEIANFIYERHYRRYLKPFEFDDRTFKREFKNGFAIMATCCLLIETLESFHRGWKTTDGRSEVAFLKFFTGDRRFFRFATRDIPSMFYKHIRCGILHQGETTGGWQISRSPGAPILDTNSKLINANKFATALRNSLDDYRSLLISCNWNSEQWENVRKKMKAVIENCRK